MSYFSFVSDTVVNVEEMNTEGKLTVQKSVMVLMD